MFLNLGFAKPINGLNNVVFWTLIELACFDSRCFMFMWEFWPNLLHVIRCLIEGLKGENRTLEKTRIKSNLTLLEKGWKIGWSYDNSNILDLVLG